jgi:hypothetical protein
MAVKPNKSGFEHAQELIGHGKVVYDERDAWSEHQPPAEYENSFIQQYGWREFGKWHLGMVDQSARGLVFLGGGAGDSGHCPAALPPPKGCGGGVLRHVASLLAECFRIHTA